MQGEGKGTPKVSQRPQRPLLSARPEVNANPTISHRPQRPLLSTRPAVKAHPQSLIDHRGHYFLPDLQLSSQL